MKKVLAGFSNSGGTENILLGFADQLDKLRALAGNSEELSKSAESNLKNKEYDLKVVQPFFKRNRGSCLGRRSGADRRSFTYAVYLPENRSSLDKRHNNGKDRYQVP
jgi:hypothetical protein